MGMGQGIPRRQGDEVSDVRSIVTGSVMESEDCFSVASSVDFLTMRKQAQAQMQNGDFSKMESIRQDFKNGNDELDDEVSLSGSVSSADVKNDEEEDKSMTT